MFASIPSRAVIQSITVQSRPNVQSWSPWRKGWPRFLWSTCMTLYFLGLTFAFISLVLVNPLTSGGFTYGTFTISGPLYQGNVFSGVATYDLIRSIHVYPSRQGAVQHKAWACTRACHRTPGCHTFVIRGDRCFLTSFNACTDSGKRYLLEWNGATTYELRTGNDKHLDKTCLAQCIENKGCDHCGRPSCSGSQCDDCPVACWDFKPRMTGIVIVYPTLSEVRKVSCNESWQQWWRNGRVNTYSSMLELNKLSVRVVVQYEKGATVESVFDDFQYEDGQISVGVFIQGLAGNGWNAPFKLRSVTTPKESNCRKFFYDEGTCNAGGVLSYEEQLLLNMTEINLGYAWHTGNADNDDSFIEAIELWVKPIL